MQGYVLHGCPTDTKWQPHSVPPGGDGGGGGGGLQRAGTNVLWQSADTGPVCCMQFGVNGMQCSVGNEPPPCGYAAAVWPP